MGTTTGKAAALAVVLAAAAAALWLSPLGPGEDTVEPALAQQADRARQGRDTAPAESDTLPERAVPPASAQDTLSAAVRAILAHQQADRGPEQPIPFSHRFHAGELRIGCEYCHTGTRRSQVAAMPPLSTCMGCHQVVGGDLSPSGELRGYWSRQEPVPWNRIYKVPEFVQFKHQPHLRSNIACQECHGPVEEMDRLYKASPLTMGWCLSCHRQEEPGPGDVATTYQLVRRADVPQAPEGRQPVGLYPYRISSGYASYRAPDDCATCHY